MDVIPVKSISSFVLYTWSDKVRGIHDCILVTKITCKNHSFPLLVAVLRESTMEGLQDIGNDGESIPG